MTVKTLLDKKVSNVEKKKGINRRSTLVLDLDKVEEKEKDNCCAK